MDTNIHQPAGDVSRPDATSPDTSRHVATGADDYISLKEAREIFLAHKRPVSERTLQRSCVKGHIVGKKIVTAEGEKWFALRNSVLNRIAELIKFDELRERPDAARRDVSLRVANENQSYVGDDEQRQGATEDVSRPVVSKQKSQTSSSDMSRPDATLHDASSELARIDELYKTLIAMREEQVGDLRADKDKLEAYNNALIEELKEQRKLHNQQLELLLRSDRESKSLAKTVTNFVYSIWPGAKGTTDGALPEAYGRIVSEVPDTLSGDEPEHRS